MTSVIFGATSMEQLSTALGAIDLTLSQAVLDDIHAVYLKNPIPM
jgi:aryl-alcohol dehydrogenase-like predicted oxidoreductase